MPKILKVMLYDLRTGTELSVVCVDEGVEERERRQRLGRGDECQGGFWRLIDEASSSSSRAARKQKCVCVQLTVCQNLQQQLASASHLHQI